jgi:hypothetical protein
MLGMTLWSVAHNEFNFFAEGLWFLAAINGLTLALSLWMTVESIIAFSRAQGASTGLSETVAR